MMGVGLIIMSLPAQAESLGMSEDGAREFATLGRYLADAELPEADWVPETELVRTIQGMLSMSSTPCSADLSMSERADLASLWAVPASNAVLPIAGGQDYVSQVFADTRTNALAVRAAWDASRSPCEDVASAGTAAISAFARAWSPEQGWPAIGNDHPEVFLDFRYHIGSTTQADIQQTGQRNDLALAAATLSAATQTMNRWLNTGALTGTTTEVPPEVLEAMQTGEAAVLLNARPAGSPGTEASGEAWEKLCNSFAELVVPLVERSNYSIEAALLVLASQDIVSDALSAPICPMSEDIVSRSLTAMGTERAKALPDHVRWQAVNGATKYLRLRRALGSAFPYSVEFLTELNRSVEQLSRQHIAWRHASQHELRAEPTLSGSLLWQTLFVIGTNQGREDVPRGYLDTVETMASAFLLMEQDAISRTAQERSLYSRRTSDEDHLASPWCISGSEMPEVLDLISGEDAEVPGLRADLSREMLSRCREASADTDTGDGALISKGLLVAYLYPESDGMYRAESLVEFQPVDDRGGYLLGTTEPGCFVETSSAILDYLIYDRLHTALLSADLSEEERDSLRRGYGQCGVAALKSAQLLDWAQAERQMLTSIASWQDDGSAPRLPPSAGSRWVLVGNPCSDAFSVEGEPEDGNVIILNDLLQRACSPFFDSMKRTHHAVSYNTGFTRLWAVLPAGDYTVSSEHLSGSFQAGGTRTQPTLIPEEIQEVRP